MPLLDNFSQLLPNEPRIANRAFQTALTDAHLSPHLAEVERFFFEVRSRLDPELCRRQPMKLGKAYPIGQCLEIAQAVELQVRDITEDGLSVPAVNGLRAFRAFRKAGGEFRQVWGDLRGEFFQNAFQMGVLYLDVANDTVTVTKPKVEILPFEEVKFAPIRDFEHFALLAEKYWKHKVYPNILLPELAPHCPLLNILPDGRFQVYAASGYMLGLCRRDEFRGSEIFIKNREIPSEIFSRARELLIGAGVEVPKSIDVGRRRTLLQCRVQRRRRWHSSLSVLSNIYRDVKRINDRLLMFDRKGGVGGGVMEVIRLNDKEYRIAALTDEMKAQIQGIRFVEEEIKQLSSRLAAMHTARSTYIQALQEMLEPGERHGL